MGKIEEEAFVEAVVASNVDCQEEILRKLFRELDRGHKGFIDLEDFSKIDGFRNKPQGFIMSSYQE